MIFNIIIIILISLTIIYYYHIIQLNNREIVYFRLTKAFILENKNVYDMKSSRASRH